MIGLLRERLIQQAQFIAKAPRQRILRHDPKANLAADENKWS